MTPPSYGDDCGHGSGPQSGLLARANTGAGADEKPPMNVVVLQDASSQLAEEPDWNVSLPTPLNEDVSPSALRGRLLSLDFNPALVYPGVISQSSSRRSSFIRRSSEPFEDAMDRSDEDGQHPSSEVAEHPAAQRLASTLPLWDGERPCRPNPNSTHDMAVFIAAWRLEYELGRVEIPIAEHASSFRERIARPSVVSSADVVEGVVDTQGIDWPAFGTDVHGTRGVRQRYHRHPHNRHHPVPHHARTLPNSARTFKFNHTNTEARPWIEHFQLRNLIATTSWNDVHYVSRSKVMSTDSFGTVPHCVMDLTATSDPWHTSADFHITSLASSGTALIAGGFRGEFAIQDLMSEYGTEPTTGYVSNQPHAIANHIHSFNSRTSSQPLAVFCSNDRFVRTVDCYDGRVINSISYDDVMNCASSAPNGRLRVLVGDFEGALIVDADSGRILEHANSGSKGHGFACAWAPNDIHVATAGQDNQILIWDARNWSHALTSIATENEHPTSLHFSPPGGGSPILIAAEASDTVNIIDAHTYASKQTINMFGDIAGTVLSADGAQLTIAAGDRHLGGLMTFSRGEEALAKRSDWLLEHELEVHAKVRLAAKARRRRGLRLHEMWV